MIKKNTYKHWKTETDNDGIVWCHIDVKNSSTNVLSIEVLEEFNILLDALAENIPKGLIIVSDKTNGFIAGADVKEFTTIKDEKHALEMLNRGHNVFNKLDALHCPTLCLINGFCLGGGMELALACDYRIVLENDKTRIGLPEVLLGIHPGFGGTMRLIRLIGPINAMQLMLQGRTVNTRTAKKMGIVDYVVPERQFLKSAPQLIFKRPMPRRASRANNLLNKSPIRKLIAAYLRRQLRKKVKLEHYPAPYALVDLWEQYGDDEQALLKAEALSVARLASNKTSRNLVRVFFLQEELKANKKVEGYEPRNIHVIGAGIMGGDIAAWCALQGMNVIIQDREPRFIAPAIQRAYKLFMRRLKHPRLVRGVMDRLIPEVKSTNVGKADIIIEAIIENIDAKTELFEKIEPQIKDDAILATNTSSISLEILNKSLKDSSRLVGIHFFNPVAKMQLVEIIYTKTTSEVWIKQAEAFCCKIGRMPLRVKSSPGFLVNRILTPYLMEAVTLYEEGVPAVLIDKVAIDFGMPMGPIELADTVGLDICLSVANNLSDKLKIDVPFKLVEMVGKGNLGKKTGSGFFQYKKGSPQKQNVEINSQNLQNIEDRLVFRILNECAACMREGLVENADMLDAGMIFGTGFPPFHGGPLTYAKSKGYDYIIQTLNTLNEQHDDGFSPDKYWETIFKIS
ncbi:MAG: 3-hydroxyacyl-CoA dehydrogenase NAD-binding domain-containing protein [Gammaproteobacteria bacterium]|jgi:3-hydroxyacyl-CoA dehydrogenase/enoyl-CoA hydratase/3-hydroxybutyryl-CoA epimerase